ncbi:MAG: hypothetical protein V5A43_05405 [Haloarculaceae archaeon]
MAAANEPGLVDLVRIDLVRMHETWMEFIYPRQRGAEDTVLGKWQPEEGLQATLYKLWSVLGVPVVGIVYPLVLLGYFIRFQTHRLNVTAVRIGAVGVVGLFMVLWGALSALAYFQLDMAANGAVAVLAASITAVISAGLSFLFWYLDGRFTTVVFAYPFAMTAIFLPPVVAALYSEAFGSVVLSGTDSLQLWLLENGPAAVDGVKDYLVENYDLEGVYYVVLWFGISVPLGWLLGILVTLADIVRPTSE